jgi:DNA-binding response OmpR family regulator
MTNVLVVEDDQMFARAVGDDLRFQGLDVAIVHTVSDALEEVSQRKFDVLLTDLRLGAQDGIDLLSALRDVSPHTRSVLMSAFATARDYQRAVELGAVRVLCKPFTPADLISCIRQAIECGSGFRGSVHGLSLVDMLQMYNYARRSVTIEVSGGSTGRLHLRNGQIVHAEHQGLVGEAAVASILAMPAGTVGTTALPGRLPRTVERELRPVLLDALRDVDEKAAGVVAEPDLQEIDFDILTEDDIMAAPAPVLACQVLIMERVQELQGYLAACLFLASNDYVVAAEGGIDLRLAASAFSEGLRMRQQLIEKAGDDGEVEELLIASGDHHHLLRRLHWDVPVWLYLLLDRDLSNPTLAKLELDHALRSLDRH